MASSPFPGRIEKSFSIGTLYEKELAPRFFADFHWNYQAATNQQNWRDHFDYVVTKEDKTMRVEVKAPKVCRSSSSRSLILLEHTGITGMPGWLQGKADIILQFLSETKALCYPREDALLLHPLASPSIERFNSYNAPIGQWFGRSGVNKKNTPNQDIIRWERLATFNATMPWVRFYEKTGNEWGVYYH